jgi:hypothetical protein
MKNNSIDQKNRILRVNSSVLNKLKDLMGDGRKIAAIKLLRTETGAGLKEAKEAVENTFQHKSIPGAFDIKAMVTVKSILVNFGTGDVSLSLNDLHMMTLVNMTQLGIEETRRILDLHDLIQAWERKENDE